MNNSQKPATKTKPSKALVDALKMHDALVQTVHRNLHGACRRARCIYNQLKKEADTAIAQAA